VKLQTASIQGLRYSMTLMRHYVALKLCLEVYAMWVGTLVSCGVIFCLTSSCILMYFAAGSRDSDLHFRLLFSFIAIVLSTYATFLLQIFGSLLVHSRCLLASWKSDRLVQYCKHGSVDGHLFRAKLGTLRPIRIRFSSMYTPDETSVLSYLSELIDKTILMFCVIPFRN
jgi:hypothetical protein